MSRYNRNNDYNNGPYRRLEDDYYNGSSHSRDNGYRYRDQHNNGSNYDRRYDNNQGYDNYNKGYDNYNKGYDNYNKGYDNYNQGYDNYNQGYDNYNQGYDNYNNNYSNTTYNKPQPAATKPPTSTKNQPMYNDKNEKVKSIFFNTMVREQLKNQKKYKPYFIYTISILQVIVFIASLVMNYTSNGRIFEPLNENISIGPSTGTLIKIGARYVPCMKKIKFNNECPPGVTGSLPFQQIPGYQLSDKGGTLLKSPFYCTMKDICGFGGLFANDKSAKQWFRFVTAIFSHSGIAHIAINLIFQVRAGMSLEKDYGHWRIMVIYFLSGIFGYMLEAQSSAGVAVVGCSGSLYGLIACILLDLIQNWKLIVSPWKDLAVLVFSIVFSLGFGLLPFIDNFAHIGGFIMGILSGLIFLPSIIFNNKDEKIKSTLRIVSIFLATFIFVIVIKRFYSSSAQCKWCKYLNCAPFLSTTCNFQ